MPRSIPYEVAAPAAKKSGGRGGCMGVEPRNFLGPRPFQ